VSYWAFLEVPSILMRECVSWVNRWDDKKERKKEKEVGDKNVNSPIDTPVV
jgi:hypothetical protein